MIPGNWLRDKRVAPTVVSALAKDFHEAHLARYKTADPESHVEFVMWRHVGDRLLKYFH